MPFHENSVPNQLDPVTPLKSANLDDKNHAINFAVAQQKESNRTSVEIKFEGQQSGFNISELT